MLDIRFCRALQVMMRLAIAAEEGSEVRSSTQFAEELSTNPSLVRKLLVPLHNEGLVICTKGRGGGARLGRPAEEITLADIYRCAVGDKPLWARSPDGEHVCMVAARTGEYFAELTAEAENAVLASLANRTLADSVREIQALDAQPTPG
ncbi:Rrf2 family transcriptional regulator [Saccharopolyspora flava]|uniref:Transcriptional regulator, BadM/Rrf2 family n=1 Tax=Saccharopolyspora flava TaxID=95161 RepID=A0A1I6U715_9PSEU|nr:Rrf2 family transcriptional regulator [Saccharopolyspora flava]SFS97215.1 transcriptional regulator, BadM/Rrf2 family [Saccharopolyspora flava]